MTQGVTDKVFKVENKDVVSCRKQSRHGELTVLAFLGDAKPTWTAENKLVMT